jgi:RNA polymerase sigma-70 factor (ECF subfamily)
MNSTIEQMQPRAAETIPSEEWSDEDLLFEYQRFGNRDAFEELVHRYETELYNYLRHYLGDAELAEDAFQGTFLQVHLKCDLFEHGRRVRPWLYTVATNQAIDARRRSRRHRMVSLDRRPAELGGDENAGALVDLVDGDEPDPLDRIQLAEQGRDVRRAVDGLAEPLREVLLLVYYQGLKYREAAEALNIPVGTVKSRLHAAIRKLNQTLNPAQVPRHG